MSENELVLSIMIITETFLYEWPFVVYKIGNLGIVFSAKYFFKLRWAIKICCDCDVRENCSQSKPRTPLDLLKCFVFEIIIEISFLILDIKHFFVFENVMRRYFFHNSAH